LDGSIVGWGYNRDGQADPPDGHDFVAIAAGEYHSLALKLDGSIVGWGANSEAPDGNDFVAVAPGYWHSLALKSDGSVVGWGYNEYGQADPPDVNDFVAIAAGRLHSLALKSNGSIVGWGDNYYGQADPPERNDFVVIAAGGSHSLALIELPPIELPMKVTPQVLNCRSKGKFVKAHMVLPEEIFPEDIDVNTPAVADPPDIESEYIKLLSGDTGPVKLQIAFDRRAFCETLTEPGEIEITVTGFLTTGRAFYATDTITVKEPPAIRKSIKQAQTRRLRRNNKSIIKF
jgi:hypothetical protein